MVYQDGTTGAVAGPRGCGDRRRQGSVYWELGRGPFGMPLEYFMVCPPVPVAAPGAPEPGRITVPYVGTHLFERPNAQGRLVTHLIDHVGSTFYPLVTDYLEEVRALGVSNLLPPSLDYGRLTSESRLHLVHNRAAVVNGPALAPWWVLCPKGHLHHTPEEVPRWNRAHPESAEACLAACYSTLEGGMPVVGDAGALPRQMVKRLACGVSYRGLTPPDGMVPQYQRAIFLIVPCTRLATIAGHGADAAFERAREARLPVALVDA